MIEDILRRLNALERQLERTASAETAIVPPKSTANVSSPPSDAELDSAFGTPATLPDPFIGVVDDNGTGTAVWLVCAVNGGWHYVAMTKAV